MFLKIPSMCVLSLLFMCSLASAQAGSFTKGSVYVPYINAMQYSDTTYETTQLVISNITDSNVTCSVTVYDQNGTEVTNYGDIMTAGGSSSLVLVASGTGVTVIPPHGTRVYNLKRGMTTKTLGHAIIGWTSADTTLRTALVAGMRVHARSGTSKFSHGMPVNQGKPF